MKRNENSNVDDFCSSSKSRTIRRIYQIANSLKQVRFRSDNVLVFDTYRHPNIVKPPLRCKSFFVKRKPGSTSRNKLQMKRSLLTSCKCNCRFFLVAMFHRWKMQIWMTAKGKPKRTTISSPTIMIHSKYLEHVRIFSSKNSFPMEARSVEPLTASWIRFYDVRWYFLNSLKEFEEKEFSLKRNNRGLNVQDRKF